MLSLVEKIVVKACELKPLVDLHCLSTLFFTVSKLRPPTLIFRACDLAIFHKRDCVTIDTIF